MSTTSIPQNNLTEQTECKSHHPRVHFAPAFVCASCGHMLRFGDYEWNYLETWYHAGCQACGGKYEFKSIKELYEIDGVYFCDALQRYHMTADCPKLDCWATKCPISEAMAQKVEQRLVEVELMEVAA